MKISSSDCFKINQFKCCACLKKTGDKNIVLVEKEAAIPGIGWGCWICDLPPNGAIAMLCDECKNRFIKDRKSITIKYACRGLPEAGEIIEIEKLKDFKHNEVKHAMHEKGQIPYLH